MSKNDIPPEIQAGLDILNAGLSVVPKVQPETKGSLFQTGVRPIIDQHLLDEAAKVRDYGNYWSASSAGYCQRKVIFERLGVPKIESDEDARKQRLFTAGHVFHDWIQGITKAAGISIAQEVELQDETLMIRGHFDDLVLVPQKPAYLMDIIDPDNPEKALPPKQHLILYDYKTVNSRSFMWAKKNGNAMSYYHRLQLGTYMYMLRNREALMVGADSESLVTQIANLSEARILKIEKENLMMMEQQLFWDKQLEADVHDYWNTLNRYWDDRKLPPCTCADQEGGFLARAKYNPFYYKDTPCSMEWYEKCKAEGRLK